MKSDNLVKITWEEDGTIEKRVERFVLAPSFFFNPVFFASHHPFSIICRLHANIEASNEWMRDHHEAEAILVATRSQSSVACTHLRDRLIRDRHIINVAELVPRAEHSRG